MSWYLSTAWRVESALREKQDELRQTQEILVDAISQRKRAEEKLRRSETYLAEGQRLSHTGSWARNVSSGEVFWSQETFRIFAFVGSRSVLLQRLCVNSLVVKDKE